MDIRVFLILLREKPWLQHLTWTKRQVFVSPLESTVSVWEMGPFVPRFWMLTSALTCLLYTPRAELDGCLEQTRCLQTKYIGWHIAAVIKLMTKCCFKMANIWNPHILHAIIWFSKCLDSWWKFALILALKRTLVECTMHSQQLRFSLLFYVGDTRICHQRQSHQSSTSVLCKPWFMGCTTKRIWLPLHHCLLRKNMHMF